MSRIRRCPFWPVPGLLLLALCLAQTAFAGGRPRLEWRTDLERARAEAAKGDRLVLVQFTGAWCTYCRRMEAESLTDPRVVALASAGFVPVKLPIEGNESLSLSYGFNALPATLVLRPGGEVVARSQGYLDADALAKFLGNAARSPRDPGARTAATTRPAPAPGPPRRLALEGNCPVTLVDSHRLTPGRPEFELAYDGRTYRFASEPARAAFRREPSRYAPVNGGDCPVARLDRDEHRPGSPAWGVVYRNHLYLCGDESARKSFLRQPERYAYVEVAGRGFCPHCWAAEGLLIRGQPGVDLEYAGLRYIFPDARHLEAFRSSTLTARR